MRKLILIGALLCAERSAFGMDLKNCEAHLLAPRGLKTATVDLLGDSTEPALRQKRRDQLNRYIATAHLGSPEVIRYLAVLRDEMAAEHDTDWIERLQNQYLMRSGNEALAQQNLSTFLESYWLGFLYGRDEHRYAWMETQTTFLVRLAKAYPLKFAIGWTRLFDRFQSELIDIKQINGNFEQAANYIASYARQSNAEIIEDDEFYQRGENVDNLVSDRQRVQYVREIIAELDVQLLEQDIDSLLKLYKLDKTALPNNVTYERDSDKWEGWELEPISPVQALVFFMRLSRRIGVMPVGYADLEATIQRLKIHRSDYPRIMHR